MTSQRRGKTRSAQALERRAKRRGITVEQLLAREAKTQESGKRNELVGRQPDRARAPYKSGRVEAPPFAGRDGRERVEAPKKEKKIKKTKKKKADEGKEDEVKKEKKVKPNAGAKEVIAGGIAGGGGQGEEGGGGGGVVHEATAMSTTTIISAISTNTAASRSSSSGSSKAGRHGSSSGKKRKKSNVPRPSGPMIWPSQAGPERLAYNRLLRQRMQEEPDGLTDEEKARATVLLARDARKRARKSKSGKR